MSSQLDLIQNAINRSIFKYRLPEDLERKYRANFNKTAVESFKTNAGILSVAFLIILAITLSTIDRELLEEWPVACGVIFTVLVTVSILLRIPALDRFYQLYTGILASIALTAASAIPFFMDGELMQQVTLVACIFSIVIVYTMSKLLLINAVIWCLASIPFTLIVLEYFSEPFDLLTFQINIAAAHSFGITLAYLIEHREKTLFLSNRLLQLEKNELNKLRKQAEQQAQRQAKISSFLETLSSDQSIQELGDTILMELAKRIQFNVGSIYYLDDSCLHRFGAYALSDTSEKRKTHELNQSLLGASLINNKTEIVNDFPAESLEIKSGLGKAKAASLLQMPISFEGKPIGGFELAAFSRFKQEDMEFLEEVRHGIGVTLNSCLNKQLGPS